VVELRERVEEWRRRREKRGAMPEELWAAAVDLARRDGVYRAARALRVDYATLKWRVAEAEAGAEQQSPDGVDEHTPQSGGFVELVGPQPLELPLPLGMEVELSDGEGARMTVRVPRDIEVDVAALTRAFLGRGA